MLPACHFKNGQFTPSADSIQYNSLAQCFFVQNKTSCACMTLCNVPFFPRLLAAALCGFPSVHLSHCYCPITPLMSLSVCCSFFFLSFFPFTAQGVWGLTLSAEAAPKPGLWGAQLGSALVLVLARPEGPRGSGPSPGCAVVEQTKDFILYGGGGGAGREGVASGRGGCVCEMRKAKK